MIRDVQPQPELVAGMSGMCEVAVHPDAEAVITGIVGCAGEATWTRKVFSVQHLSCALFLHRLQSRASVGLAVYACSCSLQACSRSLQACSQQWLSGRQDVCLPHL